MTQVLTFAHSPDADDIFMAYGLATGAVTVPDVTFSFILDDIEVLNQRALESQYPVTAISFGAYSHILKNYKLMTVGASMGEADYGPVVVAKTGTTENSLHTATVAIPGRFTSSAMILQLAYPQIKTVVMPFSEILPAVISGKVDAGLLIHESQLQFKDGNCQVIFDLPKWWRNKFNLPIPLGTNAIRRDLDARLQAQLSEAYKDSIRHAWANRAEALRYTQTTRKGNLPIPLLDRYVDMYVNQRTIQIGTEEAQAVQTLYDAAFDAGIITAKLTPEWV